MLLHYLSIFQLENLGSQLATLGFNYKLNNCSFVITFFFCIYILSHPVFLFHVFFFFFENLKNCKYVESVLGLVNTGTGCSTVLIRAPSNHWRSRFAMVNCFFNDFFRRVFSFHFYQLLFFFLWDIECTFEQSVRFFSVKFLPMRLLHHSVCFS